MSPDRTVDPLGLVRARYDQLADDVAYATTAGAADPSLCATAATALLAEARALDAQGWSQWLAWCSESVVVWVPLSVAAPHPARDQSLFLDDRRRVEERLWRFTDPNAWAVVPFAPTVRAVGNVEAWLLADGDLLVASVLTLDYIGRRVEFALHGRQIHRLRVDPDHDTGTRLIGKTMLFPALHHGSRQLGWLL